MNEALGLLAAVGSSLLGGTTVVGTRYIVGDLDALTIATMRHAVGALCFLPIAALTLVRHASGRDIAMAAALGLVFYGVFPWMFALALVHTTAARGALAMSTFPLITLALAILFGKEAFTWRRLIGILIAMAGLAYALSPKLLGVVGAAAAPPGAWRGDLTMVFAVLLGSIYAVFVRPYTRSMGALPCTAVGVCAGALLLVLMAIVFGGLRGVPDVPDRVWATIIYLGIIGTAALFWFWGIGIRHASPALVALTVTANPLVATILGAVWLDERIGVEVIVGLLLVLVGIAVVSNLGTVLRTRRRSSASPATNP